MIIGCLLCLGFLSASCRGPRPPRRGAFAPIPSDSDTSYLIEGDIALLPHPLGSEAALTSFVKDKTSLWPKGRIPYRIDEDEWDGTVEPVFLDSQIENITQALRKIETGVPCIDFKYVSCRNFLFLLDLRILAMF